MQNDDSHVGFLAADISRLMRIEFDRRVAAHGVTRAQWMVLSRLARMPGCTQSELAALMEVERATAGRLLDRLEENGLVRREADPDDRRVRRVYPTARAERDQEKMRDIADTLIDDALAELAAPERDMLIELLGTVRSRLSAIVQTSSATGADLLTAAAAAE